MATRKEIFTIVNKIKFLPNSPVTEKNVGDVVEMFFVILKDIPYQALESAALQYLSEEKPYFPMPGALRTKVLDLQLLALQIPTAAEAWGMVLNGTGMVPAEFCEVGAALRDACNDAEHYGQAIDAAKKHDRECEICNNGGSDEVRNYGGFREAYEHPVVTETVRLLGGRDAILTDNRVADRARFIEAFNEVLARERMKIGMMPEVREYVREQVAIAEERRAALDTGEREHINAQYKALAKGLSR